MRNLFKPFNLSQNEFCGGFFVQNLSGILWSPRAGNLPGVWKGLCSAVEEAVEAQTFLSLPPQTNFSCFFICVTE